MIYNDSFLDAANNTLDVAKGVNEAAGGWLYGGVLMVLFAVIFMIGTIKYDMEDVLIADGFLTAIVGALMWANELIPWHVIVYPVILLFIGIFYKVWGRSG